MFILLDRKDTIKNWNELVSEKETTRSKKILLKKGIKELEERLEDLNKYYNDRKSPYYLGFPVTMKWIRNVEMELQIVRNMHANL